MRSKNSGYSLVEIMLVLVIIMILSIVAFVMFVKVRDASQSDTETKNLTTIIVGVRNLYGARHLYNNLTTGTINVTRIFPVTMNGGVFTLSQPIKHIEGGEVEVLPWGSPPKQFAVIYHDISQSLCSKMALHYSKNVEEVRVGSVIVKSPSDPSSNLQLTMDGCDDAPVDVTFIQR